MNLIKITPSLVDDLFEIITLSNALSWSKENLLKTLLLDTTHGFCMFDFSRPIGFILYSMVLDKIELLGIGVSPLHQRQGHAERLLNAMVSHARNLKCFEILLEVRESNLKAISFYKKNGFFLLSRRTNYYSDNETACVMKKNLDSKNGSSL